MISRATVSLINRTGGAERPFLQDRHFSEASIFQWIDFRLDTIRLTDCLLRGLPGTLGAK